jgi:hypothetical protein
VDDFAVAEKFRSDRAWLAQYLKTDKLQSIDLIGYIHIKSIFTDFAIIIKNIAVQTI